MPKFLHYPRATDNRVHGHDKTVIGARRNFLKAALINFAILQLLFFGLFAYLFGSIYHQNSHVHNLRVLFIDYDGGLIGNSVKQAYLTLKGKEFPTFIEGSISQYSTPEDIEKDVCNTKYWAAIYTSPGATSRLEQALPGGSTASEYNRSNVLTYIWNEARYPTIVDSAITGNFQTLSSAARLEYISANGTGALAVLATTDKAAVSVFANPWQLTSVNIQPTVQGARIIYNTLVIILMVLQEFFYLGTINALYARFKIYERLYPIRIIIFRNLLSIAYTFIGSLCTVGTIWAFRAGWHVNGSQFVLSWLVLWLFAHVNFLSLDVFTIWVPVQYVPPVLVTWVVFNVGSILVPFDLAPKFYKWAYVMPAHEVYQVFNDIWSGGCNPQLYYALPILFALELTGLVLSGLGVFRRCHYAVIAEETQKADFQGRVDAAREFERKRDEEREEERRQRSEAEYTQNGVAQDDMEERRELGEVIRKEDTKVARERQANRGCNFGPSFDLPFAQDDES